MDETGRVIVHCVTLVAVVILAALGHEQLAAGLAVGATLPSPVSTAVKAIGARRAG